MILKEKIKSNFYLRERRYAASLTSPAEAGPSRSPEEYLGDLELGPQYPEAEMPIEHCNLDDYAFLYDIVASFDDDGVGVLARGFARVGQKIIRSNSVIDR